MMGSVGSSVVRTMCEQAVRTSYSVLPTCAGRSMHVTLCGIEARNAVEHRVKLVVRSAPPPIAVVLHDDDRVLA